MLHANNCTHPAWTWFQTEKKMFQKLCLKEWLFCSRITRPPANIMTPLQVGSWQLRAFRSSIGIGGFQGLCYLGCEICTSNLLNSGHPEPARCFWGYCIIARSWRCMPRELFRFSFLIKRKKCYNSVNTANGFYVSQKYAASPSSPCQQ